jgi:hypothetical protein
LDLVEPQVGPAHEEPKVLAPAGWFGLRHIFAQTPQAADTVLGRSSIDNQNSGPHPYAVWLVNCIFRQTAVVYQSEIKNL